jgi:hypothetical protein
MAGYMLIEKTMLKPYKADGVVPHEREIGFLDYLRELRQDVFPFARGAKLRVVGLEDALLAAQDRKQLCAEIHDILSSRANELNNMGGYVQIVFEWALSYGEELWFTRGIERVPLRALFGNVSPEREGAVVYYIAGFNLT